MSRPADRAAIRRAAQELATDRDRLSSVWGSRGFWQVRLRWGVAPLMVVAVVAGHLLGFEFPVGPVLLIALANASYNLVLLGFYARRRSIGQVDPRLDRTVTHAGVVADYTAMFLLLYFTGGASSPLVVLLILHVIIAAVQFSPATARRLSSAAIAGLWLLLLGQLGGWLPAHEIAFRGRPVHALDRPLYLTLLLAAFSFTLVLAVAIVSGIMRRLQGRVADLAVVTTDLGLANEKLGSLYTMLYSISGERRLEPVLNTVVNELAKVMEVQAVAVKLLSDDRKTLRYVAACGLPRSLVEATVIHLDQSPLNRRVIDGETLVESRVQSEEFQLQRELTEIGIRSAVLTPLRVEQRTLGTLGLYSASVDRFQDDEREFLELASRLIAVAIDDARANEAIVGLAEERTQFMLQVAHNLRAPIGASLGILELIHGGYLGPVTPRQVESLERAERRLAALNAMIGDILTIARTRDWSREIPDVVVDLDRLAAHTEEMFRDAAARKKIHFLVLAPDDLPRIDSGADLLQQVMDNLVSNAIKYTPEGGSVEVRIERKGADEIRILVRDTGIGIPMDEQDKLFGEFFRATNARQVTADGTGLGLALVKRTVERHRGRVTLTSREGAGTTVVVDLPIRQVKRAPG